MKKLLLVLLLAGCASKPVATSEAVSVEAKAFGQPGPGLGKVVVKRDKGLFGGGCSARVFINAKPVADLDTAQKVELYLPPGDVIISSQPNGICSGGLSETRVTVKSDSELYYRVGYGSNGDFSLNPTAF